MYHSIHYSQSEYKRPWKENKQTKTRPGTCAHALKAQRARSLAPSSGQKKEYCKHWNLDFLTCHSISVSVFLVPAVTSTKPMATADAVDVCKYKYLSLALENTTAISSESNSKKITHNVISIPFHSNRCLKMLHSGPPRVTNFTPGGFTSHYIHRKKKSFVFQSPSSLYPWNT